MSVDVPSEYEATETSSGLSVQIQGSEDYLGYGYEDYLAIFELIERGDDSLEDIANEYFNKDYGDNFSHNLSYGFYSYTTDNYGPLSLVTVDDNSTNPKFRPDTVCLQSGVMFFAFMKQTHGTKCRTRYPSIRAAMVAEAAVSAMLALEFCRS